MLIVEKYGGTSVDSLDKLKAIAGHIKGIVEAGKQIIVIVSAAAKRTDQLLAKAKEINPFVKGRELDMLLSLGELESATLLAITLEAMGVQAISLSAFQIPIMATDEYQQARITKIYYQTIKKYLEEKYVVIVPGFQGITITGDIVTLGRGGSDTIALAMASVFDATCYIYTDVGGVYTMDPKKHQNASHLAEISYDEMLDMALLGSKVLAPPAALLAKEHEINCIIGQLGKDPKTCLVKEIEEKPMVTGISSMDFWQMTIEGFSEELIDDFKELINNEKVNLHLFKNENDKITIRYLKNDDNLLKAIIKLLNLFPSSKQLLSQITIHYKPILTKKTGIVELLMELEKMPIAFLEMAYESRYLKLIVKEIDKERLEDHLKQVFNLSKDKDEDHV